MTTVNKSLAFNGETLIWGGNELLWPEHTGPYNFIVSPIPTNGVITADRYTANSGETISVSAIPDEGYQFNALLFKSAASYQLIHVNPPEWEVTFKDSDVWGSGSFTEIPAQPTGSITVKFKNGYTPVAGDTQTLLDAENNIWKIEKSGGDWGGMFNNITALTDVISAETQNVSSMSRTFRYCSYLSSIALFDTSNVVNMNEAFEYCYTLTSIPLFDTSKVRNMNSAFNDCQDVRTGALALYQQASTQEQITAHSEAFHNCGKRNSSGTSELAQIPYGWK